ncbi:sigma-70 family RNA polymerase sigma factor [Urbifossiella limnaea]|uniref:ECF RNA polymerase sigma factor SigE n=1 Tax=Urbifossiella limnaea TaxID=2528023 RepID=A0A517XMR3_9BACT|nr:sigma-70 family RNA polymerase sigma factor [Urbifossiella limnaea]QDU18799.1 ECF RNA polymerase sigma factor SigE [Urbifossiella limnaea]
MLPALARQFAADAAVPDAELLLRYARAADPAAFELLVWRHGAMVWAACRRVLGADTAAAEDASQAAFAALARHAGRVRAVGPWLHRVAVRAAIDLRAAGRGRRELPAALPDPHPGPERVAAGREDAAAIDAAVNALPEKLRTAFVLCELEGRSNADAAAALGCPVGTVESRLTRARQRLRARLAAGGVAPAVAVLPATVRAALLRPPSATVRALAARAAGGPGNLRLVVAAGLVLAASAVGFGLSASEPPPAPPPPAAPAPTVDPPAAAKVVARFGAPGMRHAGPVADVAFAPDGARLASVGPDAVRVWTADSGAAVFAVTHPGGTIQRVRYTADGKELRAVALNAPGKGGEVWHIHPATGAVTKKVPLPAAGGGPFDAQFSDDGKLLAVHTPGDRTVAVADAATGESRWAFELPRGDTPTAVAFSRDNQLLLVGTRGGAVTTLDAATGGSPKTIYGPITPVTAVAMSPSARTVVAAFGKTGVTAWDRATGDWKWGTGARGDGGLRFSRDGKLLFRAAVGVHASTIDPDDGRLPNTCGVLGTFFDGMVQGTCVALHTAPHYHGDDRVAFGTAGGAVVIYGVTENAGKPTTASPEPAGAPELLSFTPDGKTLRGWAGDWFAWDVASGKQSRLTSMGWKRVPLSPDGRVIAEQTESSWLRDRNDPHGGVRLVLSDAMMNRPTVFLAGVKYRVAWLDYTPDGHLLGAAPDGSLRVWDAATGDERLMLAGHAAPPTAQAVSRDAQVLVTAAADGVRVWSLTTGKKTAQFALDAPATHAAASADGSRVAVAGGGRVVLWDAAGRKELARVTGFGPVALSPDGSRLAAVSGAEVRVWSADGAARAVLRHAGPVTGLAFAPDGRTLAVATSDVPVTLWAVN